MTPSRASSERRKAQRTRLVRPLAGIDVAKHADVRLKDISRDAFSVETMTAYNLGENVEFRFTVDDVTSLVLQGRVKRCERSMAIGGAGRFLTGLAFAWKTPGDRAAAQSQVRILTRGAI